MVREILLWPDPALERPADRVKKVDASVRALAADLFETMYHANGVGLAAPQVGVGLRMVVIDVSPREGGTPPYVLVNPEIERLEGETDLEEGCLSVPGESEPVVRGARVWARATDLDGNPVRFEGVEGLLAVALQHELDHLDGTVFVEKLSTLKRGLIKRRMKKLKAEREKQRIQTA